MLTTWPSGNRFLFVSANLQSGFCTLHISSLQHESASQYVFGPELLPSTFPGRTISQTVHRVLLSRSRSAILSIPTLGI